MESYLFQSSPDYMCMMYVSVHGHFVLPPALPVLLLLLHPAGHQPLREPGSAQGFLLVTER